MGRKYVPAWVWAVLVGIHLLALSWALSRGGWAFPDSGRYLQAAENLRLYGELYARAWPSSAPDGQAVQEFTIRPPAYPLAVLILGGNTNIWRVLLVQNLLSLLNIGLVLSWWARRVQPKTSTWGVVVIGLLSFPAQFIYANAGMSEILLQTAVVAIVGASLLFIREQKKQYFAGIAIALVLALLLKPVFYPLTIILAGVSLVLAWWRKRMVWGVLGMIPLVVVGLYMEWNWQRTKYFHFSSIAEINLLHYNAAGVVRQIDGRAAEEKWINNVLRAADAEPNFAARQQFIQERAGAVLWAHPVVYARQHMQGMVAMFLDPGRFDISQFLGLNTPDGGALHEQTRAGGLLRAIGRLPLGLLGILGAVLLANVVRLVLAGRGFWQLRKSGPMLRYGRWVAGGLLFYVALLTGPLGASRFLVPVWPLLLGLALEGLQSGTPIVASSRDAKDAGSA